LSAANTPTYTSTRVVKTGQEAENLALSILGAHLLRSGDFTDVFQLTPAFAQFALLGQHEPSFFIEDDGGSMDDRPAAGDLGRRGLSYRITRTSGEESPASSHDLSAVNTVESWTMPKDRHTRSASDSPRARVAR
jgi:hypothetical protein